MVAEAKVESLGDPANPWSVPPDDLIRQAMASLRGYVYQLHQSAAAWIDLPDNALLHLEVAEDFSEILKRPGEIEAILRATQVKDTRESGRVTLNSADVLDAIESVYRLGQANPDRVVEVVFLTTAEIGKERKAPLPSGDRGLDAWELAANGGPVRAIRTALLGRLKKGPLLTFVRSSDAGTLRKQLLARLTFECGAPDWQLVEAGNRTKLVAMSEEIQSSPTLAHRAYDFVFAELLTTILTSRTRQLTRRQLVDCLKRATSIPLPSLLVEQLIGRVSPTPVTAISSKALRTVAAALLDAAEPPSLVALFPDVAPRARDAFKQIARLERTLSRSGSLSKEASKEAERTTIAALAAMAAKRHLIIGPPGSGKSHALSRSARQLLVGSDTIPLYLSAAQLETSDDLFAPVARAAAGLSIDDILSDPRVCVFIDGWSEFAIGDKTGERKKALARIGGTCLIATAKSAESSSGGFEAWTLDLFDRNAVTASVALAHPGRPALSEPIIDLLRLPLLLSIHLLTETEASSTGDLLRKFHEQRARDLPESFTEALTHAAAASVLLNSRDFGRFGALLDAHAQGTHLANPRQLLSRLGAIVERDGKALPVHDLYWNWLAGRGLLRHFSANEALRLLATRECYALALQSGEIPKAGDAAAIAKSDIVLGAMLEASQSIGAADPSIHTEIDRGFKADGLARRSRAGLAALATGKAEYLRRALETLSEVYEAGLALPEWSQALRPEILYHQRSIVAQWMPAPGAGMVLDAIAEHGGAEWCDWIEQLVANGTLPVVDALAATLACRPDFPQWGNAIFDELVQAAPWLLRSAVKRRANRALAQHIANDYDRLASTLVPSGSSGWIELNRVLVNCGDDATFASLHGRFADMSKAAQEYLGFAVVDRGEPWISAFQKVAFSAPGKQHHRLADHLSKEIDDPTARSWIAHGHAEIGWRVLIARHGDAVLQELICALPPSFGGIDRVPALEHIALLKSAPVSLIDILWSRLSGQMQPKTMQDLLNAIATVDPQGVPHIVKFICERPSLLSAYHVDQALHLYAAWRTRTGMTLSVAVQNSPPMEFSRWITGYCAMNRWDPYFTPRMLARFPDIAVAMVLETFAQDDLKAEAVLKEFKDLKVHNAELLDRMLSAPPLAALIPDVFANAFEQFPAAALHRCLMHKDVNQQQLIFRLGATSNPLHRTVHLELMGRILSQPLNIHHIRYVAAMMRGYSRFEIKEILATIEDRQDDEAIWLIREIETARGERLVDEYNALLTI